MGQTIRASELIQKKEDVNAQDPKGFSCLHAAVNGGYLDCAELLIKSGANVNAKDRGDLIFI